MIIVLCVRYFVHFQDDHFPGSHRVCDGLRCILPTMTSFVHCKSLLYLLTAQGHRTELSVSIFCQLCCRLLVASLTAFCLSTPDSNTLSPIYDYLSNIFAAGGMYSPLKGVLSVSGDLLQSRTRKPKQSCRHAYPRRRRIWWLLHVIKLWSFDLRVSPCRATAMHCSCMCT